MKKLIVTLTICAAALTVSAQPSNKRHGHSDVKIEANKSQVWTGKKQGRSTESLNAGSKSSSLSSKKHGHSDVQIEETQSGQRWTVKKNGRK